MLRRSLSGLCTAGFIAGLAVKDLAVISLPAQQGEVKGHAYCFHCLKSSSHDTGGQQEALPKPKTHGFS